MDRDQVKKFLQDRGFGAVDDHRYRRTPGGGIAAETCSWGPQYTLRQREILQELQQQIIKQNSSDMSSPLQKLSKAAKNKKKKLAASAAIKKKPRPKPKSDAELRRELAELKRLARGQLKATKAANKQAITFIEKMAILEATTEQLEAVLRVKRTNNSSSRKKKAT